jgi:hypothetical protein
MLLKMYDNMIIENNKIYRKHRKNYETLVFAT